MDDDDLMGMPSTFPIQLILDGATVGTLSLFVAVLLGTVIMAWFIPLILKNIFTGLRIQQTLDENKLKKRLLDYYGLGTQCEGTVISDPQEDLVIPNEWTKDYYGIGGYLRYNLFQLLYIVSAFIIVFIGFYYAFGLLGMSFLPFLSSFGALTYVGLFHFGDFFRNFYAYGWLIISAPLKIGDIIEIDTYNVSGVIKDIRLMYIALLVIDKNAVQRGPGKNDNKGPMEMVAKGYVGNQWQPQIPPFRGFDPQKHHVAYQSCKIIETILPNFLLTSIPIRINHM